MHSLAFGLLMGLPLILLIAIFSFVIVVIVLKGFALWYSARGGQKWWFIALLIINTLGILEIIYLLFFRPKIDYESDTAESTENNTAKDAVAQ